jgi:hypothetical protein
MPMRREQVAAALRYLQDRVDLRRRYESATSLDQPTDQDAGDVAIDVAAGFVPGVGQAQAARDFERSRRQGDRLGQLLATVGMGPVIGGVRNVGKIIDKALEAKMFRRVEDEYEALKAEYAALKDAKGGRVLNVDTARELSPEYLKDRTKSADVHEPSSTFIKKVYAERLAQLTPEGKVPVIVFTAGGTGAGKSSGLEMLEKVDPSFEKAELVYDTNMNKFNSAKDKIDQALEAGREVKILYTYRDPAEALRQGALTRATGQEGKYGSGRTVPLAEHGNTHVGSRKVIDELRAEYADNPKVEFSAIDNSRGKNNPAAVKFEDLPQLSDNAELRKRLRDELEAAYKAGEISEATYKGFRDY